ncbi:MAG: flagellar protein FlaG [Treponema sp.]|nr:flagellar protein FlaG [Treponema sp.]
MSVASVGFHVSPVPVAEMSQAARQQLNQSETKVKPQVIQSTAADFERIGLAFNRKLQFEVKHDSRQVIVKVIDKETDRVIKELPPEELQRLHSNLKEAIGLLFDERV